MAGLDMFGNGIHDFLIGDRIIIWDHDIEDDIGMGGTFDNAKIMHAKLRIDLIQVSGDFCLQGKGLGIAGAYRIHVDHSIAVQLSAQFMFDGIDGIVQGYNITVRRHLCMQRDQSPSGAVIMYDQIVDADDIIIG